MIGLSEYREVCYFLEERHGLQVPDTNHARLEDFIASRMTGKGWIFHEYLTALESIREESDLVINAATIGETYFFRDEAHFTFIKETILPFFARTGHVPLAWSAAASTGEEIVSLAAIYTDFYGLPEAFPGKLWASDINALSLAALRSGRFSPRSLRDDGKQLHPLLEPWLNLDSRSLILDDRLLQSIQTVKLNLMTEAFDAIPAGVDILILKNMMIYLSHESRKKLYDKLGDKLSDSGFLIIGKSEVPFFENSNLVLMESGGIFFFVPRTSQYLERVSAGVA